MTLDPDNMLITFQKPECNEQTKQNKLRFAFHDSHHVLIKTFHSDSERHLWMDEWNIQHIVVCSGLNSLGILVWNISNCTMLRDIYMDHVNGETSISCVHLWNHWSISLLLFEAEVLPEAADGGLDTRVVLIIGGGDFLPRTHRLLSQSADPGWA